MGCQARRATALVRTAVVHQPNYLPGCTYFDKIASADVFVVLDSVQYVKGNWINRNRIKTPSGVRWVTVPVKYLHTSQLIADTRVDADSEWQRHHRGILETNYSKAPHFRDFAGEILEQLSRPTEYLAEMNRRLLDACVQLLGISTEFVPVSQLGIHGNSTEMLVNICKAVGADRYLSGPGGRKYMDIDLFAEHGIDVIFQEYDHPEYNQLYGHFEPNLSVCDLLFNEGARSLDILRSGHRVVGPDRSQLHA